MDVASKLEVMSSLLSDTLIVLSFSFVALLMAIFEWLPKKVLQNSQCFLPPNVRIGV